MTKLRPAVRNLFTYDDHVAITHGMHKIEAGVRVQRIQANDDLPQYQYRQAFFGSLTPFLQGTVSTFTVVSSPTPLGWCSVETAGFVQDAIRIALRLQLRPGFRFEGTNGWDEAHDRASTYLFDSNGIQPDAYTPTILSWTFKIEQQIAPDTTDTTHWFSEGVSSYNSLTVDVTRRFTHRLQLRGVYTWSKNLDDGTAWNSSVASSAPGFVMFPLNPKIDHGLATTDVRNLAVLNGTYELPFGAGKHFGSSVKGWQQKLIGGWSTSAIVTLQTGLPFTPQLGYNPTGNGSTSQQIQFGLKLLF